MLLLSTVADAMQYMVVYQCILGEINNVAFWVDGSSISNLQVSCKVTESVDSHTKCHCSLSQLSIHNFSPSVLLSLL